MTTFTGQNIGAGKLDRAQHGAKQGTLLAVGVSVVMTGAVLIFGRSIMSLFTKTDAIIDTGMRLIRILSMGFIGMAVTQSLSGVMRGAGDAVTPMWISILISVVLRVPLSYLLVNLSKSPDNPLGCPEAIYYAMMATWLAGTFIIVFGYRFGSWRKRRSSVWKISPRVRGTGWLLPYSAVLTERKSSNEKEEEYHGKTVLSVRGADFSGSADSLSHRCGFPWLFNGYRISVFYLWSLPTDSGRFSTPHPLARSARGGWHPVRHQRRHPGCGAH
jgi:hypothetical protein